MKPLRARGLLHPQWLPSTPGSQARPDTVHLLFPGCTLKEITFALLYYYYAHIYKGKLGGLQGEGAV